MFIIEINFIVFFFWVWKFNVNKWRFFFWDNSVRVFFLKLGVIIIFKKIWCILVVVVWFIGWFKIIMLLKIEIGFVLNVWW